MLKLTFIIVFGIFISLARTQDELDLLNDNIVAYDSSKKNYEILDNKNQPNEKLDKPSEDLDNVALAVSDEIGNTLIEDLCKNPNFIIYDKELKRIIDCNTQQWEEFFDGKSIQKRSADDYIEGSGLGDVNNEDDSITNHNDTANETGMANLDNVEGTDNNELETNNNGDDNNYEESNINNNGTADETVIDNLDNVEVTENKEVETNNNGDENIYEESNINNNNTAGETVMDNLDNVDGTENKKLETNNTDTNIKTENAEDVDTDANKNDESDTGLGNQDTSGAGLYSEKSNLNSENAENLNTNGNENGELKLNATGLENTKSDGANVESEKSDVNIAEGDKENGDLQSSITDNDEGDANPNEDGKSESNASESENKETDGIGEPHTDIQDSDNMKNNENTDNTENTEDKNTNDEDLNKDNEFGNIPKEIPIPRGRQFPSIANNTPVESPENPTQQNEKMDSYQDNNAFAPNQHDIDSNSTNTSPPEPKNAESNIAEEENVTEDGNEDKIKTGSTTKNTDKDSSILIMLFAGVVVVGVAAFGYNYIKKRKQGSATIEQPLQEVRTEKDKNVTVQEMHPLMNGKSEDQSASVTENEEVYKPTTSAIKS